MAERERKKETFKMVAYHEHYEKLVSSRGVN